MFVALSECRLVCLMFVWLVSGLVSWLVGGCVGGLVGWLVLIWKGRLDGLLIPSLVYWL